MGPVRVPLKLWVSTTLCFPPGTTAKIARIQNLKERLLWKLNQAPVAIAIRPGTRRSSEVVRIFITTQALYLAMLASSHASQCKHSSTVIHVWIAKAITSLCGSMPASQLALLSMSSTSASLPSSNLIREACKSIQMASRWVCIRPCIPCSPISLKSWFACWSTSPPFFTWSCCSVDSQSTVWMT